MSKTITLSRFDGGISDPRETSTTMCTSVRNFYPQKTKLTPYRDTVTETLDTGTLANQALTDAIRFNYTGSTTQIFALGKAYPQNYPKLYQKSTGDSVTASFQAIANNEDTDGVVIPGSLIGYKGAEYCLKTKSGSTYLVKFVRATSTTEIGAVGVSPTFSVTGGVPKPFIHPKDNRLYMASGYTMGSYDGTTLSTRDFSIGHNITSITWQGNNIVIGMNNKDGSGSVLGIWNGSITSSELTDVVEFGSDTLMILDNLNDVVVGVSALSFGGASDVGTQNFVTIRGYAGGQSVILKRIEGIGSLGSRVYPMKAHKDSKLFFPMSTYLNGTRVHQIWAVYKNEQGLWVVRPDRKVNNDTELTDLTITGFSMIGDYMWVAFDDGSFRRTSDQSTYTATSTYETLINPSMSLEDRTKKKQLKSVSVAKSSTTGQVVIKYSVDGLAYVTIGTLSASGSLVLKATNESDGKPFNEGYEYIFKLESTNGAEITEFKYSYDITNELI